MIPELVFDKFIVVEPALIAVVAAAIQRHVGIVSFVVQILVGDQSARDTSGCNRSFAAMPTKRGGGSHAFSAGRAIHEFDLMSHDFLDLNANLIVTRECR
jgi:hypothetical protein